MCLNKVITARVRSFLYVVKQYVMLKTFTLTSSEILVIPQRLHRNMLILSAKCILNKKIRMLY